MRSTIKAFNNPKTIATTEATMMRFSYEATSVKAFSVTKCAMFPVDALVVDYYVALGAILIKINLNLLYL